MFLILAALLFSNGYVILGITCIVLFILGLLFLWNPYVFSKTKEPDFDWFKHLPVWRKVLVVIAIFSLFPCAG